MSKQASGRWALLSPVARCLSIEISRALNDRGELSLGWRGVEGLAALFAIPVADVVPAFEELLASRSITYDAQRSVVLDPEHVANQRDRRERIAAALRARGEADPSHGSPTIHASDDEAEALRAEVARLEEELAERDATIATLRDDLSKARDACRQRVKRASRAASREASRQQCELPVGNVPDARSDAGRTSSPDPVLVKNQPRTGEAPSVRPPVRPVTHDPTKPEPWAFALRDQINPSRERAGKGAISDHVLHAMWEDFAGRSHVSEGDARDHFRSWLWSEDLAKRAEREAKRAAVPTPPEPELEAPPASERRVRAARPARTVDAPPAGPSIANASPRTMLDALARVGDGPAYGRAAPPSAASAVA